MSELVTLHCQHSLVIGEVLCIYVYIWIRVRVSALDKCRNEKENTVIWLLKHPKCYCQKTEFHFLHVSVSRSVHKAFFLFIIKLCSCLFCFLFSHPFIHLFLSCVTTAEESECLSKSIHINYPTCDSIHSVPSDGIDCYVQS